MNYALFLLFLLPLQDFSKKLNQDLPEVYDPVTKLMRTTVENDNMVYHFLVDANQKQYDWAMPKVKEQVLKSVCKNQNQKMILTQYKVGIVYRYENTKGQSLGEFLVRPEHCFKN